MSEYQGVQAAAKGNPVIKWAKKHPAAAAGILGGVILLVVLFKPKDQAQESSEPTAGPFYPDMTGSAGGGGGSDYSGEIADLYTQLEGFYGALGTMNDENAAQMEGLTSWVNDSMSQFSSDISAQFDSLYGELEGLAQQQPQMIPTANPYQQINPLTGQPLTGIGSALSTGIKRLDLNIPEPETFEIRSRMDQVGDRWGQLQAANGGGMPTFEMMDLHAENLLSSARIGGQFNPTSGTYSWLTQPVTSFRSDLVLTGNTAQDQAKARIASIGEQWGGADAATRETLHARAESIAKAAGGTFNPSSGTYTWS
jgi:hypothetical protein